MKLPQSHACNSDSYQTKKLNSSHEPVNLSSTEISLVITAVKMMGKQKLCPKLLIYLLCTDFKACIIYRYIHAKYPLPVYFGGN